MTTLRDLGLGLSICVKAVKRIGGQLRIRDLPSKGCIFTIALPVAATADLKA
jgi:signal transduction histidine kinase